MDYDLHLPEEKQRRVAMLASNPVAQARAYQLLVEKVAEILFGIPISPKSKKTHKPRRGLFGVPVAFYGVTEVQTRNALHAHFVLWIEGLDPRLIHKIAHIDDLRARILKVVDSVICASAENFEHVYRHPISKHQLKTNSASPTDTDSLVLKGHKIKSAYNTHVHSFTCHKYKDSYRARHCRMSFGRRTCPCTSLSQVAFPHWDEVRDEDKKIIDRVAYAATQIDSPESRKKKGATLYLDMKRLRGFQSPAKDTSLSTDDHRLHKILRRGLISAFMNKIVESIPKHIKYNSRTTAPTHCKMLETPKKAACLIMEYLFGGIQLFFEDDYQASRMQ